MNAEAATAAVADEPLRHVEILLVDDNPGDIRLLADALRQVAPAATLTVAEDGARAADILLRRNTYRDAARPALILLDLNLPGKSGHEVLKLVKSHEKLRRIPVLVLTTSSADHDVLASYDLHANCFITKPNRFDQLLAVLRSVVDFWLHTAKLPG